MLEWWDGLEAELRDTYDLTTLADEDEWQEVFGLDQGHQILLGEGGREGGREGGEGRGGEGRGGEGRGGRREERGRE